MWGHLIGKEQNRRHRERVQNIQEMQLHLEVQRCPLFLLNCLELKRPLSLLTKGLVHQELQETINDCFDFTLQ